MRTLRMLMQVAMAIDILVHADIEVLADSLGLECSPQNVRDPNHKV